jgi:hypothetical protein
MVMTNEMFLLSGCFQPVRLAYQPLSHQPAVFSLITNQPPVLFCQNKPAPAISHQPNEQAFLGI